MKKFCITLLLSSNFLIHSDECNIEETQKTVEKRDVYLTFWRKAVNVTLKEGKDNMK